MYLATSAPSLALPSVALCTHGSDLAAAAVRILPVQTFKPHRAPPFVASAAERPQFANRVSAVNTRAAVSLDAYELAKELPKRMNTVPHTREMRQFFYRDVCDAVQRGCREGLTRMSVRMTVPETNPEMDVYRIGTLLEMLREVATTLVQDGQKVKVCVQQAMGQGVFQGTPLALSGVMRIMKAMDWGDVVEFVSFGNLGTDQIDDASVYLVLAPQNVTGDSVLPFMEDMVAEAERQGGKRMVIFNSRLDDIPSANGVMGVRGRKERMEFVSTFTPVYHFRLLYVSGSNWPIMGAMRHVLGGQWEVYRRLETGQKLGEDEEYRLMAVFDTEPDGGRITKAFAAARK